MEFIKSILSCAACSKPASLKLETQVAPAPQLTADAIKPILEDTKPKIEVDPVPPPPEPPKMPDNSDNTKENGVVVVPPPPAEPEVKKESKEEPVA